MRVPDVEVVLNLSITVNGQPHDDDLKVPVVIPRNGLVYGGQVHQIAVGPMVDKEPSYYGR